MVPIHSNMLSSFGPALHHQKRSEGGKKDKQGRITNGREGEKDGGESSKRVRMNEHKEKVTPNKKMIKNEQRKGNKLKEKQIHTHKEHVCVGGPWEDEGNNMEKVSKRGSVRSLQSSITT